MVEDCGRYRPEPQILRPEANSENMPVHVAKKIRFVSKSNKNKMENKIVCHEAISYGEELK